MAPHTHTHDEVDWAARLDAFRRRDTIEAEAQRGVAERVLSTAPARATVVDVGSGAGGMSAKFAAAMRACGGGTLVLVDAVPELLEAATGHVHAELGEGGGNVDVRAVLADAADDALLERVPGADVVWASRVVHHVGDQQGVIRRLAGLLVEGGWLALAEGGLGTQCLPWDLGVARPGLADRLMAARAEWFVEMRASIEDSVRLPVGWPRALRDAGLREVTSFSYLVDHPAPVSGLVRDAVLEWLEFLADVGADRLDRDDRDALGRLLDPNDPAYVGARDDVFYLVCDTVHIGRKVAGATG